MRTVITMAVFALSVGVSACSGPKEQAFGTPDAQAIRQATTTLETAFNAKEVDKILPLYTDNSVFMRAQGSGLRAQASGWLRVQAGSGYRRRRRLHILERRVATFRLRDLPLSPKP
jgi:hypothetical protein